MHRYALALGSNRRHGRFGSPEGVLAAATRALAAAGLRIEAIAPVARTAAIGPGGRSFANGALIVATPLAPPALLDLLKRIERDFGRRPGRRWGARVLDIDMLLWSGGRFASRRLTVPHARLTSRRFVLDPLAQIAPRWRLPDGSTVAQARARLTRPAPLHRSHRTVGP